MLKLIVLLVVVATVSGECPSIKSRSDWGAKAPKKKVSIGNDQPYVIIHHTETPECDTSTKCTNRVKSIQNYHMNTKKWDDIGYNFLVDPQGVIYEGRGWGIHGAHSPAFNSKSIGISVIGTYKNKNPSAKAITAVKKLIECGVSNNKISQNYKLLGHRQTRATDCPGDSFYSLIKTWPKWVAQP